MSNQAPPLGNSSSDDSHIDEPYMQALLSTLQQQSEHINHTISQCAELPIARHDAITLSILQIGCYELSQCPDIPYLVVIDEAVKLAKKFGPADSQKYINAVLDCLARRTDRLQEKKPAHANRN